MDKFFIYYPNISYIIFSNYSGKIFGIKLLIQFLNNSKN